MLRACVFVFGFVLGCACEHERPRVFAFEGSDAGFEAALAAAAQWSSACGVELDVRRGGDGVPLVEVPAIEEAPRKRGATTRAHGRITRVRFVRYEQMETTLAHEFGHVLGLPHADHGLMAEEAPGGALPRVTERECEALRRL